MIKDKELKKIIELLEAIQLSESFSTMRHVPTEYTLTLKRKLRQILESYSKDAVFYLYLLVHLGEANPSLEQASKIIDHLHKKRTKDSAYLIDYLVRKEGLIEPLLRGNHILKTLSKDNT